MAARRPESYRHRHPRVRTSSSPRYAPAPVITLWVTSAGDRSAAKAAMAAQ
ncbi:hypothetical protein OUY22_04355 [Nonomuraea sp. MCN248]|uniref:Uncharacterized protein n=1 Tax=Nonomuraea corallina TaxID=2989783 RepID=A0ABT4S622_9ACTN|nr:hypothetical protein [Nonomuraea corallina]MDA0632639.1 hypothetical protein [Nonomuraea corallina]